jgi:hypothetical protein
LRNLDADHIAVDRGRLVRQFDVPEQQHEDEQEHPERVNDEREPIRT